MLVMSLGVRKVCPLVLPVSHVYHTPNSSSRPNRGRFSFFSGAERSRLFSAHGRTVRRILDGVTNYLKAYNARGLSFGLRSQARLQRIEGISTFYAHSYVFVVSPGAVKHWKRGGRRSQFAPCSGLRL